MNSDRTFERIQSLLDVEQFAPIRILIAGCGSGGGNASHSTLVTSGIRNFRTLLGSHDVIGPGKRNQTRLRQALYREKEGEGGRARRDLVGQKP